MASATFALYNGKGAFELREGPLPKPLPGSVVLKVYASGVCGSDLYYYGIRTQPETSPGGHEIGGEVVAAGDGVTSLRKGDRVAVEMVGLASACMKCWFCRDGEYIKCVSKGARPGGGFATHMQVPAQACFRFPENMTWQEGAMVEPLAVSLHGVRKANMKSYETAVVLGAGTIGLTCVAALSASGVRNIVVTYRHPQQAEAAKAMGATTTVKAEDEKNWLDAVFTPTDRMSDSAVPAVGSPLWDHLKEVTDGRGADAVFECVGGTSGASLNQAIAVSRKAGRVISVGAPKVPVPLNVIIMLRRELSLTLSHCYSIIDGRHDYEAAIGMIASGDAPVGKLVTHEFGLADINRAFEVAAAKKSGSLKVQLLPQE
jgi:threonine dehydrogenase-like Zn-dependent dehydrogenase